QGRPGARRTHGPRATKSTRQNHRYEPDQPAFPARVVLRLIRDLPGDARESATNRTKKKAQYFSTRDWTTQISLKFLRKIPFWCIRCRRPRGLAKGKRGSKKSSDLPVGQGWKSSRSIARTNTD